MHNHGQNSVLGACAKTDYHGVTQVPPGQPQTGLESILSQARSILNFVSHQGERIEAIGIKLHGAQPGEGSNSPKPIAAGIIAEIDDVLGAIMTRLHSTDEAVSSIQRGI